MRKIFNKSVVVIVGFLSLIGISVGNSDVFAFTNSSICTEYDNMTETTPLYLFHGSDLVAKNDSALQAHYSHSSHQSHSSHYSHRSHYSSRY